MNEPRFRATVVFGINRTSYRIVMQWSTNVHQTNIVGVGLALYYNHLVFIAVVAGMSAFILTFSENFLSMHHWSVTNCGYGDDEQSREVVISK